MMNEGPHWFLLVSAIFYVFLYSIKLFINLKASSRMARISSYLALLVSSWAIIYYVFVDWNNGSESRLYHWLGVPIILLTIPTVTFFKDLVRDNRQSLSSLVKRSVLEVVVVFPVWVIATLLIFARLGWVYF